MSDLYMCEHFSSDPKFAASEVRRASLTLTEACVECDDFLPLLDDCSPCSARSEIPRQQRV